MNNKPFPFSACKECVSIGGGSDITVDSELSETSKNPVQNKVVTKALDNYPTKNMVDGTLENYANKKYVDDAIKSIGSNISVNADIVDNILVVKAVSNKNVNADIVDNILVVDIK